MALADTARLIASLDLKGNFNTQLRSSTNALGSFESRLDRTQSRAYRAGQQIGTGIKRGAAIAATALIGLGTTGAILFSKSLGAASDLSETISKVGVVFKAQGARVLEFGKTSAAALGLSQNAALGAAATYGNLFVSMGLTEKKSADMSIRLTKLASDLASFNNIDPAEALEKLRAGLTGESEPLKTLGINLNEQTLKAKALELGLVKLGKGQKQYTAVLPPAIKAQAAYALILEQSKTAQGDFARTQGGLANQTRILKANWEDLKATLAGPSLPAVAKVMQAINKAVKDNQPEIAKLGDNIAGLFSDSNIRSGSEFLKGMFQTAKTTAPIIAESAKATFGFVQKAVGLFRSLPPEIQKLAVGAFAINKLTGGLVTNIAGGIIETVGKQFLQRGGTPANPLFVADVTGGLGKAGGILPAAGGAGLGSKVLGLASKVFIVGLAAEAASLLSSPVVELGKNIHTSLLGENNPLSDFGKAWTNWQQNADWPFGQKNAPEWAGGKPANTTPSTGGPLGASLKSISEAISGLNGSGPLAGIDTMTNKLLAGLRDVTTGFKFTIGQLKENRDPRAIENAIKTGLGLISKGRGNISDTKGLIAGFKTALKNTHDPKLRAALQAAIHKVEARLPAREFAARQLAKADALIRDGKVTNRDLKDLKSIERALKDRGLPHAASVIKQRIATAQHAQVEASRWAGSAASSAIKAKKWQFTTNVTVNTEVSIKNQIRREHQLARVTLTPQ